MKKLLEKHIEKPVVEYAKKMGMMVLKLNAGKFGGGGWPDRMFLAHNGVVLYIEFKQPGGNPTELQMKVMSDMAKLGHEVWVVDSVVDGKRIVDDTIRYANSINKGRKGGWKLSREILR